MLFELSDIQTLLLNGYLQGLHIGQAKAAIIEQFGQPLEWEPQKKNNPAIFAYGILQVYLFNSAVTGFSVDNQRKDFYDNGVSLAGICEQDVMQFLSLNAISHREHPHMPAPAHGSSILVNNLIHMVFIDGQLLAFGYHRYKLTQLLSCRI